MHHHQPDENPRPPNPTDPDHTPSGPDGPDLEELVAILLRLSPTMADLEQARRCVRRSIFRLETAPKRRAVAVLDSAIARLESRGAVTQ